MEAKLGPPPASGDLLPYPPGSDDLPRYNGRLRFELGLSLDYAGDWQVDPDVPLLVSHRQRHPSRPDRPARPS